MRGKSVHEVCQVLGALSGTLTVLLVPRGVTPPPRPGQPRLLHVRAHFDYDPEDDVYIPCRELGNVFTIDGTDDLTILLIIVQDWMIRHLLLNHADGNYYNCNLPYERVIPKQTDL